jgi:hypothetical protein
LPAPRRIAGQIDFGAQTARRVVDILQQRGDGPMRFEFAAQIVHHALDLAEDHGDRPPIRRLRDARGLIRLGCARSNAK